MLSQSPFSAVEHCHNMPRRCCLFLAMPEESSLVFHPPIDVVPTLYCRSFYLLSLPANGFKIVTVDFAIVI